jgi:hypothetical protein
MRSSHNRAKSGLHRKSKEGEARKNVLGVAIDRFLVIENCDPWVNVKGARCD